MKMKLMMLIFFSFTGTGCVGFVHGHHDSLHRHAPVISVRTPPIVVQTHVHPRTVVRTIHPRTRVVRGVARHHHHRVRVHRHSNRHTHRHTHRHPRRHRH